MDIGLGDARAVTNFVDALHTSCRRCCRRRAETVMVPLRGRRWLGSGDLLRTALALHHRLAPVDDVHHEQYRRDD
jgi:hypothetical protein